MEIAWALGVKAAMEIAASAKASAVERIIMGFSPACAEPTVMRYHAG
jgi:hypothetical protein